MSLVVLGIDPGLANTGWAVVECEGSRYRCRDYGCVTSHKGEPVPKRLGKIHASLTAVIERESPDECAVESVYFSTNAKTAFATGQARGVALLATAHAGLPVGEYGPSEIKQAVTGYGSADKDQVKFMVRTILGLEAVPSPDHAADALAVAICHANSRGVYGRVAQERDGAAR